MRVVRAPVAALVALAAGAAACNSAQVYLPQSDSGLGDPRPCERESPTTPEALQARRAACRKLCDQGSRAHCEVWARVCQTPIPGGRFCPAESVQALAKACELGSAGACQAAAKSLERGEHGVKADAARAAVLAARVCQLDPTVCFKVDPAAAEAALKALDAVKIPGGTFTPGKRPYASASRPAGAAAERITVPAFDIDRTEVTVGAYAACVTAGKCTEPQAGGECNWGKPDHLDHPMNCVSVGEAAAFCSWRGRQLPTEDQWELAARGTDGRPYPWGKTPPEAQLCWKSKGTCRVGAHPTGRSPYGVLDLEGNVEEWTTSQAMVTNAAVPGMTTITRGGSYADTTPARMGLDNQHYHKPYETMPTVGFRCVSPPAPSRPQAKPPG